MDLSIFNKLSFLQALKEFFKELQVPVNYMADEPDSAQNILTSTYKDTEAFHLITDVCFLGMVDDAAFEGKKSIDISEIKKDYDGILIFGVTLDKRDCGLHPTRSQLAEISRAFNREFKYTPVIVVFKYGNFLAFANTERSNFKQQWREGEKVGKVTTLKDISFINPHEAHSRILDGMKIEPNKIDSFQKLYNFWQVKFSLQALNDHFYSELQKWFYNAVHIIKLPFKPDYITEQENNKNFLVRLLSRLMFCWFVKEKGLIQSELLEIKDWDGKIFPLVHDVGQENFNNSNSYYRGILQNIFFNALNKESKKSPNDFEWKSYLHEKFNFYWMTKIPYLNGGIFDRLEEDNADEGIDDNNIHIPNLLFYGTQSEELVISGRGKNKTTELKEVEHKGLNQIFNSYKFTLEENTPKDEDIALDPELLGLVFENLLAELDPNLEENVVQSIRKLTGSYYTPRKIIQEIVNESLYIYLKKNINPEHECYLSEIIYNNHLDDCDDEFCASIVKAIDKFKMLDPACGSGAFPMGMLHRLVEILKLVDKDNSQWLKLKLKPVDNNYRDEFEKNLRLHLNDYSRKLGIIRDSIYGIDIQPMAVQITKLRFFISLLIDQKTESGITPMPNIETKILCADSLKNIQPDLFSTDAIESIKAARLKYYRADISHDERNNIANDIVDVLDKVFPLFSFQITGRRLEGENKKLIRSWFTHATLAAPFFNMDFFFPEISGLGFDCVIGNPPYGGTNIDEEVRTALNIGSNDPYGAFISRFLSNWNANTPLKQGGVLSYIVSDTFLTIKSHFLLRKQIIDHFIHKIIRVHPDTFGATVNTAIMICERNTNKSSSTGIENTFSNSKHICQMVDMTRISIHDNYAKFIDVLHQTEGVIFSNKVQSVSNDEYAIYYYPQSKIRSNSNLPFFVANPKLFNLVNDGNDKNNKPKTEITEFQEKKIQVSYIEFNDHLIKCSKFGAIADVKKGIDTGNNHKFLYQHPEARGNYRDITEEINCILNEDELLEISGNSKFVEKIKYKGFSRNKTSPTYYKGKYIIPYEKGGESDIETGWLPNYFVPNSYYIDWSENSVRILFEAQNNISNKATLRNQEYWFKSGLTFSLTGFYAPTIRLKSASMFDNKSSGIFPIVDEYLCLGILSSKLQKYIMKNFIMHTVDTQVGVLTETVFCLDIAAKELIIEDVKKIIDNQKRNNLYDYASHEQIEIDRIVYESYGLAAEDINEVENWYARRYPKLSSAQKENLRRLGKSDNYLVLYGLKKAESVGVD